MGDPEDSAFNSSDSSLLGEIFPGTDRNRRQQVDSGLGDSINTRPSTANMPDAVQHSVSIHPPQWNAENVRGWFASIESQFVIKKVTDNILKFHHLVAHLPVDVARLESSLAYRDTVLPTDYSNLKIAIIARFAADQSKLLSELLDDDSLGDSTPSDVYQKMVLLSQSCTEPLSTSVLFNRWVRKLPQRIADAMLALESPFNPVKHLPIADRLFYSSKQQDQHISAVDNRSSARPRVKPSEQSQSSSVPRSASRASTNRNNNGSSNYSSFCYFHQRFGQRARKCIDPCQFKPSGNESQ